MKINQIKSGAIIAYITIFFNIAAGLVYTPWMVRQIGVSDYGLYSLIGAFLSYFLIDFGLGSAIARFIAKFRAEGNEERINHMIGVTTRIYLLIDLVIVVVLIIVFFLLSNIFRELTTEEINKLRGIYLVAGFFSIASFPFTPLDGVMIAYERFFVLKLSNLAQKIIVIGLMVFALLLGHGLYTLILVNGLVGLGIKIYKFFYIRQNTKIRINIRFFDKIMAKELLFFSSWMFVIGIAQRLLFNIVPTILGVFSGSVQIAIFSIGLTIENYIWNFAYSLNGLFLPKVTQMITANDNRKEVTDLMIKVGRLQLLVVGPLITGIVILGKPFIRLWMGEAFIPSYYVVLFLALPGFITHTQEIASTLLVVVNEIKFRAIIFIIASVLSVLIGVFLSPSLGALGSAIGVGTALTLCHVIGMNIVYSKILHLDILRFFKSVHIKMLWPLLVAGGLILLSQQYYAFDNWFAFLLSVIMFIVVYFLLMWPLVMNREEKKLILSMVHKVI